MSVDKQSMNNISKLEDYQKNLELLQEQRNEVKKLTELLNSKDTKVAEMEKKEVTYKHCIHKIQVYFICFFYKFI